MSREEAVQLRGLKERGLVSPRHREKGGQEWPPSLFFDDLLDAKMRKFNPRHTKAEDALLGQFRHLHTDIHGKQDYAEQTDLIPVIAEQPIPVCPYIPKWVFLRADMGTKQCALRTVCDLPDRQLYK